MIQNIADNIVREMNDPNSPWTQTELFVRLLMVEEAGKFLEFSSDLAGFSAVFSENSDESF